MVSDNTANTTTESQPKKGSPLSLPATDNNTVDPHTDSRGKACSPYHVGPREHTTEEAAVTEPTPYASNYARLVEAEGAQNNPFQAFLDIIQQ